MIRRIRIRQKMQEVQVRVLRDRYAESIFYNIGRSCTTDHRKRRMYHGGKDPASDADAQAEQIKEMINEGINAIFLCPVDWEKITPSLQALQDAGVKIINIDSQVKDTDYIDAYVGSDNIEAGKLCGNDLIEKYPDGGTVAILEATTQNSVNDRITGFEQAVAKAEKGFEVVAREDTNGTLTVHWKQPRRFWKNNRM